MRALSGLCVSVKSRPSPSRTPPFSPHVPSHVRSNDELWMGLTKASPLIVTDFVSVSEELAEAV